MTIQRVRSLQPTRSSIPKQGRLTLLITQSPHKDFPKEHLPVLQSRTIINKARITGIDSCGQTWLYPQLCDEREIRGSCRIPALTQSARISRERQALHRQLPLAGNRLYSFLGSRQKQKTDFCYVQIRSLFLISLY